MPTKSTQKGFNLMTRISRTMSKNTERQLVSAYKKALKDIKADLLKIHEKYEKEGKLTYAEMTKYNRLTNLYGTVNKEIGNLTGEVNKLTKKLTQDQYEAGFFRTVYLLEGISGSKVITNYGVLNTKTVQAAIQNPISGLTLNERLEERRREIIKECKQSITQGLIKGEAYVDMAKRVTNVFEKDIIKANRVAQTEAHRAHMAGRTYAIEEAAKKGIPIMKVWDSALDEATRPAHQELDGKKVKWDEDFHSSAGGVGPSPGQMGVAADDVNCRCSVRAEIPGFEPEERRARIGDTPESEIINFKTYNEWAAGKGIPTTIIKEQQKIINDIIKTAGFTPAKNIQEAEEYIKNNYTNIKRCDYSNFDLKVANKINEQFSKLEDEYPEVVKEMVGLSNCNDLYLNIYDNLIDEQVKEFISQGYDQKTALSLARRAIKRSIAGDEWAFSINKSSFINHPEKVVRNIADKVNGIGFNTKWADDYDNFKQSLDNSLNMKYHPIGCNTVESVFTHEFGHQIDSYLLRTDPDYDNERKVIHRDFLNEVIDTSIKYRNQGKKDFKESSVAGDVLSRYAYTNDKEFIAEAFAEYKHNPNPSKYAKRVGKMIDNAFSRLRKP
jgi:SPP1 gp7 family putative phage head morphogenesis protein